MTKTAVILFNLGGPDSKESIEPFLFNFFMDPNIIRLPKFLRYLLAKRISRSRTKNEAGTSYGLLGNKSPLLENSQAQARALEKELGPGFRVFVCMRYWHPMAPEIVEQVRAWGVTKIILLPLYPQFSTTTTWSSLGVWGKAAEKYKWPTSVICCYPFNEGFVSASAENIRHVYQQAQKDGYQNPRLLFSAHGLPEMVIKDGDPYQWQCEESARRIAESLGIPGLDWIICYQSRVGRLKWIGPSTEEELERAARDKRAVVIYPHAFTQEHIETLVEIEIEYREKADHMGVRGFYRVPTVSTHPAFIGGLARLVREHQNKNDVAAEGGQCICPENFNRCCMRSL
jgi:protoporphyrin/coproporphyrin ferrochelatase